MQTPTAVRIVACHLFGQPTPTSADEPTSVERHTVTPAPDESCVLFVSTSTTNRSLCSVRWEFDPLAERGAV